MKENHHTIRIYSGPLASSSFGFARESCGVNRSADGTAKSVCGSMGPILPSAPIASNDYIRIGYVVPVCTGPFCARPDESLHRDVVG